MRDTGKFKVGDIVWFAGQCTPPLTGDDRRTCVVIRVDDPDEPYMRSYRLKDLSDGEISSHNFADLMELKA